jgi:hypothetical protein
MRFRRARNQLRCRKAAVRGRAVLEVSAHVDEHGRPVVVLHLHDGTDALMLSPLEVGQLRGQLREKVLTAVDFAEQHARTEVDA